MAADVPPLRYRSTQARSAGPANGRTVSLSRELDVMCQDVVP